MKKTIICIAAMAALTGCTDSETRQQINMFWMQQYIQVMAKLSGIDFSAMNTQPAMPVGEMTQIPLDNELPQPMPAAQELEKWQDEQEQPLQAVAQKPVAPRQRTAAKNEPVLDVQLEDEALEGVAPYADRVRMKRAITAVQRTNKKTLAELKNTRGTAMRNKAAHIFANTEEQLQNEAAQAADFQAYFSRQRQLLAQQEKAIKRLLNPQATTQPVKTTARPPATKKTGRRNRRG